MGPDVQPSLRGPLPPNPSGPFLRERRGAALILRPTREVCAAVLGDLHFPYEDPTAMRLAGRIVRSLKPDLVVLNGDVIDAAALSPFLVNPALRVHLEEELAGTARKLERLRAWAPEAAWIMIAGNHETRLRRYIYRLAPALASLTALSVPALLGLHLLNIEYLDWLEEPTDLADTPVPEIRLGPLHIRHGDGGRVRSGRGVAHRLVAELGVPVLVGHFHQAQSVLTYSYDGRPLGAWVTGCLCRIRQPYLGGQPAPQGLAVVSAGPDGSFGVEEVRFMRRESALEVCFRGRWLREPAGREGW